MIGVEHSSAHGSWGETARFFFEHDVAPLVQAAVCRVPLMRWRPSPDQGVSGSYVHPGPVWSFRYRRLSGIFPQPDFWIMSTFVFPNRRNPIQRSRQRSQKLAPAI